MSTPCYSFEALTCSRKQWSKGKTCMIVKNTGLGLRRTEFFLYRYSSSLSLSWKQRSFSSVNCLATYWWKAIFKGSRVKATRKLCRIYSFLRQIQCMSLRYISQNFGTSKVCDIHRHQKLSRNLFSILQRGRWMYGELEVIFLTLCFRGLTSWK